MSELDLADSVTDEPAAEVEAGAVDEQPSAAVDTEAPEAEAVEPVAAPAWTPDDPAFREAVAAEAAAVTEARIRQLFEEAASATPEDDPGEEQPFSLDPLAEDFGAQLAGFLQQRDEFLLSKFGEMLTPVLSREEQERTMEGEQRMKDVLADIASRKGDFPQDKASKISSLFFQEAAQRYGRTPRAAEVALEQAADFIIEIRKEAEQAGYRKAEAELAGLSGAHREPAGDGSGRVVALDFTGNELDFADEYVAKHGAA